MSYQRSKAPLSLMEQLIMVFVFAFAAAICLQAFVYSDRLSKDSTTRELASMRATEVIEVCKAYGGDLAKAAEKISGTVVPAGEDGSDNLIKSYAEDNLEVDVRVDAADQTARLRKASVSVFEIGDDGNTEENPVYTVNIAWQVGEQS